MASLKSAKVALFQSAVNIGITIIGWRVAEYALLSSRGDAFLLVGGIFAGLFGLLSLIYFLVRR